MTKKAFQKVYSIFDHTYDQLIYDILDTINDQTIQNIQKITQG